MAIGVIIYRSTAELVPDPPSDITLAFSNYSVQVNWQAVAGMAVDETIGYALYRDGIQVYRGGALGFTDNFVSGGRTYSYRVSAYGRYGEGEKGNPASISLPFAEWLTWGQTFPPFRYFHGVTFGELT